MLARLTRLPAGALLGPMLLTAVLAASGLTGSATVPGLVVMLALAPVLAVLLGRRPSGRS